MQVGAIFYFCGFFFSSPSIKCDLHKFLHTALCVLYHGVGWFQKELKALLFLMGYS